MIREEINRRPEGGSFHDQPEHGWPTRRVIWSCEHEKGPLLTRYFLLRTPFVAVYLHHLHASDEDRALHDHPWSFVAFLLSSGYFEWVPGTQWRRETFVGDYGNALHKLMCGDHCFMATSSQESVDDAVIRHNSQESAAVWRRRFSILWRPAEWQHRLELVKPTWTLVVRFRRRREWGFITPAGWLNWRAYGKEWCD